MTGNKLGMKMDFSSCHLSVELNPKLGLQGVHFVWGYGVNLQEENSFQDNFFSSRAKMFFNFARPGDKSPPELCSAAPEFKRDKEAKSPKISLKKTPPWFLSCWGHCLVFSTAASSIHTSSCSLLSMEQPGFVLWLRIIILGYNNIFRCRGPGPQSVGLISWGPPIESACALIMRRVNVILYI